ncbi:MAG: PepSY domain-containing protein [Terriglobales bacterium]
MRKKTTRVLHCFSFVLFAAAFAVIANAQEQKINRSDLPAPVEQTVAAQSQGATIRGFSKEKDHGQTFYEVELMQNGHSKDVEMDATGAISEVEEQVAIDSLPAAVKEGLQARAGKGRLLKVESITRHDKLVAYEAQVKTGAKRSEVQVDPNGKPLNHEE